MKKIHRTTAGDGHTQQGTVRLLVTVEASGMPSSVEVQTSSGFGALDRGVLDQVRRHWR